MSSVWSYRGHVPAGSIRRLVVSPTFRRDRTVVAVTLAGLSMSRDGGQTWAEPSAEGPGPFVGHVVLSSQFAHDGKMLATSPAGLFRSLDAGRTWQRAGRPDVTGSLCRLAGDKVMLIDDVGATVWRTTMLAEQLEPQGKLQEPVLMVAADAAGERIWCATSNELLTSWDQGSTWEVAATPAGHELACLAAMPRGAVALGTVGHGILLLGSDGSWSYPEEISDGTASSITASDDGSQLTVAAAQGVWRSVDAGRTFWQVLDADAASCVATDDHGSLLIATLVGGRTMRSVDGGEHWTETAPIPGTLVAEVVASGARLVARTADAQALGSDDGGRSWERVTDAGVTAIASDAVGGSVLALHDDSLLHEGQHLAPTIRGPIGAVAITGSGATARLAAANDTAVAFSSDGGLTWTTEADAMDAGSEITGLAFGRPGDQAESLLVVAGVTAAGEGQVRVRLGYGSWRTAFSLTAGVAGVRVVAVEGSRGVFASLAGGVYRPARVGAVAFARQDAIAAGEEIVQVAGYRDAGCDPVLVVVSSTSLRISMDGGLEWAAMPTPPGSPLTAVAVRSSDSTLELCAIGVGGYVHALALAPGAPASAADPSP